MSRGKVATKFNWLIVFSILLSLVVSSLCISSYLLHRYSQEVHEKDMLQVKGLVNSVRYFFDHVFSLNYQLSINPLIADNVTSSSLDWEQRNRDYMGRYEIDNGFATNSGLPLLVNMQEFYDFVELFFVQDAKGDQTARSFGRLGHRAKRWWFQQIVNDDRYRPFISKSYFSMTGNKPVASAFHPIFKNSRFVGVIGTDINFEKLQMVVERYLGSRDLYAIVIDNEGNIVAHPDRQVLKSLYNLNKMTQNIAVYNPQGDAILDDKGYHKTKTVKLDWSPEVSEYVDLAIHGKSGMICSVTINNIDSTMYYAPVLFLHGERAETNYAILLVRDNSTVKNSKLIICVFVVAFSLLASLIFSLFFQHYFAIIVLAPLAKLSSAMKQVDRPRPEELYIDSNDEFQLLAETYNQMQIKLAESNEQLQFFNQELEQRVEERTHKLIDAYHKLVDEINERKDVEKKFKKAMADAEEANKAKGEFLANMSHEFRTPMHAILSFSKFGIKKIESADREKMLGYFVKINDAGNRLMPLLNDILDMSKLESRKTSYAMKDHDLLTLAKEVAEEFDSLIKDKGVELLPIEDLENTTACFDRNRIGQVIRNMLANAIKFTPEEGEICFEIGHSMLEVHRQRGPKKIPALTLSVSDQGIGIPEDELESIFDQFVQSSLTRTGAGGTGLGLAICKRIIEGHHGVIWAENKADQGGRIAFTIPRSLSEN